jgi:hypothetical protein
MNESISKTTLTVVNDPQCRPSSDEKLIVNTEKYTDRLKTLFTAFVTVNQFIPGQLIRWKPELKNRKRPAYGEPIIVVDILESPVHDPAIHSGSPLLP